MKLYIIGSLRNPKIPEIGIQLREAGHEVFDDWFAAGPIADDSWRDYEQTRGRHYAEALYGHAARNVFEFDRTNIVRQDAGILVLPAGKSGHLELGWMLGRGQRGYVLFPDGEPERWDVMYQFANGVAFDLKTLTYMLSEDEDRELDVAVKRLGRT